MNETLKPPIKLALAYAPNAVREASLHLFTFDARWAGIVIEAKEPMIAGMKLAWWFDALSKPVEQRPKGEPLLAGLAGIAHADQREVLTQQLLSLLDAWRDVIAVGPEDELALHLAFAARGRALFGGYHALTRSDAATLHAASELGAIWSQLEFGIPLELHDVRRQMNVFLPKCRDRSLRPLSILFRSAMLRGLAGEQRRVRSIFSVLRLFFHAMTGR